MRKFTGTILKINDEAEFTPKNVQTRSERTRLVYGVKVSFLGANDDEILKPGMTIEIELPSD
jgi:HlyD family secretion protein